jgi:hypothetical protein
MLSLLRALEAEGVIGTQPARLSACRRTPTFRPTTRPADHGDDEQRALLIRVGGTAAGSIARAKTSKLSARSQLPTANSA